MEDIEKEREIITSKMNEKNYDEVILRSNNILLSSKVFVGDINTLGMAYYQKNEFENAYTVFMEIYKLTPNIPYVRTNIAKSLWMLGLTKSDIKEQIKLLKEALSYDSECYEIWYHLSLLYLKKNKAKNALYCMQMSAKINNADLDVQVALAKILKLLNRNVESSSVFKAILEKQPENESIKTEYNNSIELINKPTSNRIEIARIMYCWRNIQKVREHLYIGSGSAAQNLEELKKHNITHILNVSAEINDAFVNSSEIAITYKDEPFADIADADIIKTGILDRCLEFIETTIQNGGNILVHCQAGMSRSGAIVVGYLMKTEKLSYEEALSEARKARKCVSPNNGFEKQLVSHFNEYFEKLNQPIIQPKPVTLSTGEEIITVHDIIVSKLLRTFYK